MVGIVLNTRKPDSSKSDFSVVSTTASDMNI